MLVLNFLYVYQFLLYRLRFLQVFELFQFSFFQERKENYYSGYVNFEDIDISFKKITL